MSKLSIARIVSVLAGAGILFGLQQGLGYEFYIAFPVALAAYVAVKVGLGLIWGLAS
jgi:hypothetical protein